MIGLDYIVVGLATFVCKIQLTNLKILYILGLEGWEVNSYQPVLSTMTHK